MSFLKPSLLIDSMLKNNMRVLVDIIVYCNGNVFVVRLSQTSFRGIETERQEINHMENAFSKCWSAPGVHTLNELILLPGFKYYLHTDSSQIYISRSVLSSELQTHPSVFLISNRYLQPSYVHTELLTQSSPYPVLLTVFCVSGKVNFLSQLQRP